MMSPLLQIASLIPLISLASGTIISTTTEWPKTIPNRHQLAKIINTKYFEIISDTQQTQSRCVLINGYYAGSMLYVTASHPLRLVHYLFELMQTWNEIQGKPYPDYRYVGMATHNLIQFTEMYLKSGRYSVTLERLQDVYQSLKYLFAELTFFNIIYFDPYTSWMSDGALQYQYERIGHGSQADVIKVYNVTDPKQIYALKIFKSNSLSLSCQTEENILTEIQNKLNLSDINVPRIFGHYCANTNSILMEFIHGVPIGKLNMTNSEASKALAQISTIVVKLGRIGIGHFDINTRNILKEVNGDYWLIDFGCAVSLPVTGDSMQMINAIQFMRLPIFGYVPFMAQQTVLLNNLVRNVQSGNVCTLIDDVNITKLIIEGNLYSLQATILWNLLTPAYYLNVHFMSAAFVSNLDIKEEMSDIIGYARKIEKLVIQNSKDLKLYSSAACFYFVSIWQKQLVLLDQLDFNDGVLKMEQFQLLKQAGNVQVSSSHSQYHQTVAYWQPRDTDIPGTSSCLCDCVLM